MQYKSWIIEELGLIIEKYEGQLSMSEVLSNDNDLVSKTNFENIKCITDISNATLID